MPVFPFCSTLQRLISIPCSSARGVPLLVSRNAEIPKSLIQEKHMPNRLLLIIGLAFFAAVHSMPSQAAQWRIISTTYGSQFYPGWSFEDGQYTANDRNSVFPFNMATSLALPSATSGYITTLRFADWSALYPQMTPPYVDLTTSTINLSSLVQEPWRTTYNSGDFSGWYSYKPYDVSYNIGALTPVPFTANGDGTYTATWITPDPLNGYPYGGGATASITFALASSVNIEDPGITDSGDVSKAGKDVYIGTNATGTRTVERPGHNFDNIFLGNTPGVDGNLVIRSVPESRTVGELTAAREMVIGNYGTGTVNIQSLGGDKYTPATSARLTGSSIVLGKQAGATGTLTSSFGGSVSAQGANGIVIVGDAGSGTVNLTSTALSSASLVLGSQATGVGQVNLKTSSLSMIGAGATLSIGREGSGNLSLTPSKNNYVNEFDGSGLTVTDPVNASASIFVGQYPGSQGTLNVCGECTLVADTLRIGLDENDAPGGAGLVNLYAPFVYAPIAFKPKLVKIGPNGVFMQYGSFDPLPSPLPSLNFDLVNQGAFSSVYFGLNGNLTNSGIFEHWQAFWVPVSFTFKKDFTQTASGILKVASLYVDPYFGGVPYKVLGAVNLDGAIEVQGNQIHAPGLYPLIEDSNGIAVGPNFRVLTPNLPAGYSTEAVITPTLISLLVTSTQADLSLSLTASASTVLQGQTVTYAVTVTNNGPGPATGITLSGLPGCTLGSSTLASGASTSCTASVTATTVGTLNQSVSVNGNEPDPNTANNNASVSTTVNPAADLALSMTDSPDPVKKGAKLVYTLTLTNNGPSSATNVSLTDILPANISFEGVSTSQGKCSGKATVTCAIGTLSSGASATVKITIKPFTVGTITNSASASASVGDPNTANNNASATTQVYR